MAATAAATAETAAADAKVKELEAEKAAMAADVERCEAACAEEDAQADQRKRRREQPANERGGNQGTVLMPLNFILLTHCVLWFAVF